MNKYDNILKKFSDDFNNTKDKVFIISDDGITLYEKDCDEELRNSLMVINTFLEHPRDTHYNYDFLKNTILDRVIDSHNNLILICKQELV